jgi:hypothetical protein
MTWLWRFLPFIGKGIHALEVGRRDEIIAELREQVIYWRTRAERLTDSALARAGAIHEPTFVDRKVSPHMNPAAVLAGAMSITEIDSSKAKGQA